MLLDTLKNDVFTSMKAGDHTRVDTLRFLIAAVRNMAIDKYGASSDTSLTDADVMDVIKKQVKTHKESIEAFSAAGRTELAEKERKELTILSSFLPAEISDAELEAILTDVAHSGETNFGLLMRTAMAKVDGKADGGRVSAILRKLMQAK